MLSLKPILTMMTAGMVVACAPEDQPDWMAQNDTIDVQVTDQQQHQQVAEFRGEAEQTLQELRSDLDRLQPDVREEQRDRWDEISRDTEDKWQELREDLNELERADADEQRDLRGDIADRLAELEAEVARAEIEFAADRQALVTRTEERLSALEQDLQEIEQQIQRREMDRPGADRPGDVDDRPQPQPQPQPGPGDQPRPGDQPGDQPDQPGAVGVQDAQDYPADRDRDARPQEFGQQVFDQEIDRERIQEIRAELQEARQKAMAIPEDVAADQDHYESERDELAEMVADLTHEVRKARYDTRWTDDEIL